MNTVVKVVVDRDAAGSIRFESIHGGLRRGRRISRRRRGCGWRRLSRWRIFWRLSWRRAAAGLSRWRGFWWRRQPISRRRFGSGGAVGAGSQPPGAPSAAAICGVGNQPRGVPSVAAMANIAAAEPSAAASNPGRRMATVVISEFRRRSLWRRPNRAHPSSTPSFSNPSAATSRPNFTPGQRSNFNAQSGWAERANNLDVPMQYQFHSARLQSRSRSVGRFHPNWYHGNWHDNWNHPWYNRPASLVGGRLCNRRGPDGRHHALGLGLLELLQPLLHGPGGCRRHVDRLLAADRAGWAAARRSRRTQGGQPPAPQPGQPAGQSLASDQATQLLDAAAAAFGQGDYTGALAQCDQAIAKLPNDPLLHEFRGLTLFALHRYKEAAGTIYAVLSVGPGWDWTTLVSLYPDIDVYTQQLRDLEQYVNAHRDEADARFLLAYQYLTCGHTDAAASQFKAAVELDPKDQLSAQLLAALTTTEAPARRPQRTGQTGRGGRVGRPMDGPPRGRGHHRAEPCQG